MYIYSHNPASEGAKSLAKQGKFIMIRHENSKFVGSQKKIVINWGSRNLPEEVLKSRVLNPQEAVSNNANKLSFFQTVTSKEDAPRVPEWTVDPELAKQWVIKGSEVVARTTLNGSSGEGIHFMSKEDPESFVQAPLYTKYVKKKEEFRVHFCNGEIIDYQRKALRSGFRPEGINWRVRNLSNGFVFVRGGVDLPPDVIEQANRAIRNCELDFGAIDLIYNEGSKKAYVLEINTAPGLQGETLNSYANAFAKMEG